MELVKRAGASIFLNTYVTREDALYLNLAIRKAALGLEVASDAFQNSLADIDLDEVVGHTSIPGLTELAHAASFGMSVGASGLRYIGNFIEHAANDLLQGVMAAGILYYHGMALAAECLALDEEHRRSPQMTRTISEAMAMACAPAGQLLRETGPKHAVFPPRTASSDFCRRERECQRDCRKNARCRKRIRGSRHWAVRQDAVMPAQKQRHRTLGRSRQLPVSASLRTYPLLDGVNLAASPICRFL